MLGFSRQERLDDSLFKAARNGDLGGVTQALANGANIEAVDSGTWRMTPLGVAAYHGRADVVRLLVQKGAKIDAKDKDGDTPLHNGVRKGDAVTLAALLELGAPKDAANKNGETAGAMALKQRSTALYELLGVTDTGYEEQKRAHARALREREVEAERKAQKEAQQQISPLGDAVTVMQRLGNRVLEETFNFRARERITLLRDGVDGPVEAMVREGFSRIDDQEGLRAVFEAYRSKGGKVTEAEAFPDALGKTPLPGRNL